MRRTEAWWRQEAERQTAELQRVVWPNSAPRRSAAQRMFPHLAKDSSFRTVEISRPEQARPKTAAKALFPNLK
jgi:hypothetical protein